MGKKRLHPLAVFSMENFLLLSCGSSLPLHYNALAGAGLCLFARLNFSMLVRVPFPEVFGFVRFFSFLPLGRHFDCYADCTFFSKGSPLKKIIAAPLPSSNKNW